MALPFWLYTALSLVAIIAAPVGFLVFVLSALRPEEVYINTGKRSEYVKLKDAPSKYEAKIRQRLLARKRTSVLGLLVAIIAASFLIWTGVSGEASSQWASQEERAVQSYTEKGADIFVEPPTVDEVREMRDGGTVDLTIYSANGEARTIPFILSDGDGIFSSTNFMPKNKDDRISSRYGPYFEGGSLQEQTERKYRGTVYSGLEETYGIFLTDEQRTELLVPTETPEHLIRYGSTPLTTSLGDGTYFNGTVTLIWDGGYKLIGNEGTDQAEELARR